MKNYLLITPTDWEDLCNIASEDTVTAILNEFFVIIVFDSE